MNSLLDRVLVCLIDLAYYLAVVRFKLLVAYLPREKSDHILIMPASAKSGNLGDQAMLWGLYEHQESLGEMATFHLCTGVSDDSWQKAMVERFPDINYQKVWRRFLSPLTIIRFAKIFPDYSGFYLLGADTLDGYYGLCVSRIRLRLLMLATMYFEDVRALGFSFNHSPRGVTKLFQKLNKKVVFKVRDPVSRSRLENDGVESQLVADLAFMMSVGDYRAKQPVELVRFMECNRDGSILLAVNVNCLLAIKFDNYLPNLEYALAELMSTGPYRIFFLPHDMRDTGGHTDYSSCEDLYARLVERNISPDRLYLLRARPQDAAFVKGLVGQCDMLISGRMHLGIAAVSQGVPCLFFEYQGKQGGMLQMLDLAEDCLVRSSASGVLLSKKVTDMLDRLEEHRFRIESAVPPIKLLSQRNLCANCSSSAVGAEVIQRPSWLKN